MDSTKTLLRSLLTASPMALTVHTLSKEYRNTIGQPIPYHKFGYTSLEQFLRSIPDTVQGSGPYANVNLVVSEKSSHVCELVSKQKTDRRRSARQCAPRRRTVISNTQDFFKKYVPPATRPQSQKIVYPTSKPFHSLATSTVSNSSTNQSNYQKFEITSTDSSFEKPTAVTKCLEQPSYTPNATIVKPPEIYKDTNNNGNKESVISVAKKLEDMNISTTKIANIPKLNQSHMPSDRVTPKLINMIAPPEEHSEEYVPVTVRNNLQNLIGKYPEGIWCADLPAVYRQMFKRPLNYQNLGFRNLIDLCLCLKSVFHYVRPSSEDFKLYDRSKPLPDSAEKIFTVASYGSNQNVKDGTLALPSIDWTSIHAFLPQDIFKPGREIPRTFVPDTTQENDTIDIMVGEVFDVSKFWVYKDDGQLDKLMDDMQLFYDQHADEYKVPRDLIREGLYCTCIIFGEYHRAVVVNALTPGNNEVRLFYIDYGTIKIEKTQLFFLREQFAELPAQTIRCRLADICPPEKGAPWTRECTQEFKALIKKRDMTAKINRINWKDKYLEIFLADVTDSQNVFYINNVLVEKGHAVFLDQEQKTSIIDSISTPIVNLIHLFPTFLELENGLAPSTSEMDIYYGCNIPINFCYPQYFFTDCTEEENIVKAMVHFYESNLLKGLRSEIHRHFSIDTYKIKDKPLDMSHFMDLEEEIREYWTNHHSGESIEENECVNDNLVTDTKEDESILTISKKIEMWKSQTVNELRKDCILSEDIMKDILNICQLNTGSDLSGGYLERDLEPRSEENNSLVFTHSEDLEQETNYSCRGGESVRSFGNHPLNDLSFSRSTSLNSLECGSENYPEFWASSNKSNKVSIDAYLNECSNRSDDASSEYMLSAPNSEYTSGSPKSEDGRGYGGEIEVAEESLAIAVREKTAVNPTNPFLSNLIADEESNTDIVTNNGRLHPTNPFLSYIPENKDEQSDENSDSTTSTSYGTCVEEIKIQTWSTVDHRSVDMSISQYTSSLDSLPSGDNVECTTEPSEEHLDSSNAASSLQYSQSLHSASPCVTSKVQVPQSVQNAPETRKPGFDVNKPEFYPQNYFHPTPYSLPTYYPCPYPYAYPSQPYIPSLFNPYYNLAQQQINSQFVVKSTFMQKAQTAATSSTNRLAICPPPGFAPDSNHYPRQNDAKDFYEAYNETLKTKLN